MGNDAVDAGDRRARAWELSEELRRIVEALAVCDVAPDQLDAATRLARELRSRLGGPPRSRWYDADEATVSLGPESRSAYLEHADLRFEGWIDRDEGRRIVAKATCHAGNTLTADAEGLFMRVDFNQIEERMQQRRRKAE